MVSAWMVEAAGRHNEDSPVTGGVVQGYCTECDVHRRL